MKAFPAILLVISILGVSVFGFLGMQAMHDAQAGCLASFAGNTPCPLKDGMFAFALFHLQIFKSSVATAFAPVPLFVYLLIVLLAFTIAFFETRIPALMRSAYFRSTRTIASPVTIKKESWLGFHERSPSYRVGA